MDLIDENLLCNGIQNVNSSLTSHHDGTTYQHSPTPLLSPSSQSSTYSIDSGIYETIGASPSQLRNFPMAHHQSPSTSMSSAVNNNNTHNIQTLDNYGSEVQQFINYYGTSTDDFNYQQSSFNLLTNVPLNQPEITQSMRQPYLEIIEQPADKPFRFRYKSEMHGTHGSLMGINTERSRRTYPSVKLNNFNFPARIRCTLYQVPSEAKRNNDTKRSPHSHKLVIRSENGEKSDPHDIDVSVQNDYTASFQGMGIIHTVKRHIREELRKKICAEKLFELGENHKFSNVELHAIEKEAKEQSEKMNLNQVCLCFQAYVKHDTKWVRLCDPVYSNVINNMKNAQTGELRITRMSNYTSPASGGFEIFMFVEKVCKHNIQVRFFEENESGDYWEDFGIFTEADVHHQYGIVLKTPPYKCQAIEAPVNVKIQLFRKSDNCTSEPLDFRYKPNIRVGVKRPRLESSEYIPTVIHEPNSSSSVVKSSDSNASSQNQQNISTQMFGGSQNYSSDSNQDNNVPYLNDSLHYSGTLEVNFSQNNLKSFNSFLSEDFFQFLDADMCSTTSGQLQFDSVATRTVQEIPTTSSSSSNNCLIFNKLKFVIQLFKDNFDEGKLKELLRVLVEAESDNGENILFECIHHGTVDDVKNLVMILAKYDVMDVFKSLNDLDQNCLHLLILNGCDPKLIKMFVKFGADINQVDVFGQTPLHISVIDNSLNSLEELLGSSPNINVDELNDDGFTPLHIAAKKNNLSAVKMLIKAGADPYKKHPLTGNNVLQLFLITKHNDGSSMDLIKCLITNYEELLVHENNAGMNALQLIAENNKSDHLIEYLSSFYEETYQATHRNDDDDDKAASTDSSEDESSDDLNSSKSIFDEKYLKDLCRILDENEVWEKLLILLDLDDQIDEWRKSSNPSRKLIMYLEKTKKTFDEIKELFAILDLDCAVNLMTEMVNRKLLK